MAGLRGTFKPDESIPSAMPATPDGLYVVSIAARNETGALAKVARLVATHKINMRGFIADEAGIHLLTSNRAEVEATLAKGKLKFSTREVHEVLLEDRVGSLADLCERLAAARIDIVTAFGLTTAGAGRVYINVDDLKRAGPILAAATTGPILGLERLGRIGKT